MQKLFATRRNIVLFSLLAIVVLITALVVTVLLQQQQPEHRKSKVARYDKVELTFPYEGNYSNPNDPTIVDVEAVFTTPGGKQQTVPGFFFQDFRRSGNITKETLTLVPGSERWKVRYAPSEVGTYTYTVTLKDAQGTRTLGSGSLEVTPSSNPGFVRAVGLHLQRDNGERFIPLGINAPWFQYKSNGTAWGDGTYGVDAMYQQLTSNGANYFHLWTCNWSAGRPAPFAKPNIGCDGGKVGTAQMSQPDSWDMDYMVDQAHAKDIYIMPILKHRDQQVFEDADKIKSRYFVARWGYSTNIMGWDFNKEGGTNAETNHAWASYMHEIDLYDHIRTTSQWNHFPTINATRLQQYTAVFSDPLMTLVQTHDYTADCPDTLNMDPGFALFYMKLDPSGTDPRDFHKFDKPSFIGETGVHPAKSIPCVDTNSSGRSSLYSLDHRGLIIKSQIWGSLMGTSGGYAPWDFQFDPGGSWTQIAAFKGARAFVNALPPIPDAAQLFTTYKDSSQASTSDSRLRVIGRKASNFVMLYIQNTTGTALAILHGQTPRAISGTVTLKGMQAGVTFTVRWFDTDSGALVQTQSVTANAGNIFLALPQSITQNIAAIVTVA